MGVFLIPLLVMIPRWMRNVFIKTLLFFQTCLSRIAWALGPLCVVVAFGLIFMVTFVYFTTILPHYISTKYLGLLSLFHIFNAVWLAFNLPFNYFMCISTSPGFTEKESVDRSQISEEEYEYDYCNYCRALKPERAHHCTVCDRCTLRMDHHCPWMANCVGHFNYKYFVLFLLYMTVSCFYVAAMGSLPQKYGGLPPKVKAPYFGSTAVEFSVLLCISVGLAVGAMLVWHLFLIATQQTTIEFYQNQMMKRHARKHNRVWRIIS